MPQPADALPRLIARGRFPWWTAPDFHVHLLRPLASASLWLDHVLFGRHAFAWHLHSLLWYAALLLSARALFRCLLGRASATLALWVFAFANANVFPFAWLSARHGLQVATLSALGLTALVRARRDGFGPGRWLAPSLLGLSLLAGEGGLGGLAFALSYDLFAPAQARFRARIVRALPLFVLGLLYLGAYAYSGAGARHSGGYLSPLTEPGAFLAAAVVRIPLLLAGALLGVAPELANTGAVALLVSVGLCSTLLAGSLWRACARALPARESAALRWLLPGALSAIFVASGGYPGARALLLPNLAFAPLLAVLMLHGTAGAERGWARRGAVALLVLIHLVLAPVGQLATQLLAWSMGRQSEAIARDAVRQAHGRQRLLIVAASDPMAGYYPAAVLAASSDGAQRCWGRLSAARAEVLLSRTGSRSFSLEPVGTTFVRAPFETLFRSRAIPFAVGDERDVCGVHLRVAAVRGGLPARLEIRADRDLDRSTAAWFVWRKGALQALAFPKVGGQITIAWSPGPSRMY